MSIQTYLGFDVGTKKTGISLGNTLTNTAQGIDCIMHHKDGKTNWIAIDEVISQYQPTGFVVGLPINQGEMQEMSYIAKSFAKKLIQRYNKPVHYADEYLSSSEAKNQLKWDYRHKNASRGEVDKLAAALILQTWLNDADLNQLPYD